MASHLEEMLLDQILLSGLPEPLTEFRFSPPRRWRFDGAWLEHKIAYEAEGGTWSGGRHSRGKGYTEDCIKYGEAALQGWVVLRFTGDLIKDGRAIQMLQRAFKKYAKEKTNGAES